MRLVPMFSVMCAFFHQATATNCTSQSKSQVAGKHVTFTVLWSNQLTLDEQLNYKWCCHGNNRDVAVALATKH